MPKATVIPIIESAPSVSQLLYTHRKLSDLARGNLPCRIVDEIVGIVSSLEVEIATRPSANIGEFAVKFDFLLPILIDHPTEAFANQLSTGIRADLAQLGGAA